MMDPNNFSLKIRSHNINGFSNSKSFLYQECNEKNFSILAVQEHWLRPAYRKINGINQLKILHPDFDAFSISAMDKQMENSILKGRPYGGTGFVFNKDLTNVLRARIDLNHSRVSVMELRTVSFDVLLINAYMPYYDPNNLSEHLDDYCATLAHIEHIMITHPTHKYVLLMDMNCDIFKTNHPYSIQINSMMNDFGLISTFQHMPGFDHKVEFTRYDVKKNSYTLIDGILISDSLSSCVESCSIIHPPTNVSDHLPIDVVLNLQIDPKALRQTKLIQNC